MSLRWNYFYKVVTCQGGNLLYKKCGEMSSDKTLSISFLCYTVQFVTFVRVLLVRIYLEHTQSDYSIGLINNVSVRYKILSRISTSPS